MQTQDVDPVPLRSLLDWLCKHLHDLLWVDAVLCLVSESENLLIQLKSTFLIFIFANNENKYYTIEKNTKQLIVK